MTASRVKVDAWALGLVCLAISGGNALAAGAAPVEAVPAHASVQLVHPTPAQTVEKKTPDYGLAKMWGLSKSQWDRYLSLKQGPVSSYAPSLDPVWVLGDYARTDEERRQMAELAVRNDVEFTGRVAAWQRAYYDAQRRLYPNMKPIDLDQMRRYTLPASAGGRLALFVAIKGCPKCSGYVDQVLQYADRSNTPVDIFITDAESHDRIRTWAASVGIDPDKVFARSITLNDDNGLLAEIGRGDTTVPALFHRQENRWIRTDLLQFITRK